MGIFVRHKLVEDENGSVLLLYVDPMLTEFSNEFGGMESSRNAENLEESAKSYIKANLPNVKINVVKIMVGSLLLTTLAFFGTSVDASAASISTVQASQAVEQGIKIIINGQPYRLSQPAIVKDGATYLPIREIAEVLGGDVWWNAETRTAGINKGETKISFVVGASTARVNGRQIAMQSSFIEDGKTMVPLRFVGEAFGMTVDWDQATRTVIISSQPSTYTVKAGDSLWKIANTFGLSVDQLQKANQLEGTVIYAGQQLRLSAPTQDEPQRIPEGNTISYISYTIQAGDNMWNLSNKFGVPMTELLRVNHMTSSSPLTVGQKITIPVHEIAVKETVSERYGEYLDWWTEAQYVFPIGKVATVRDFQTGRTFQIKRTIGANHADCEPLTAKDAAIIKEIWGGAYSWKERAVIVEVDGRRIAASMASMPHDIEYIADNNFNGHFDIHFRNSTRHNDGLVSAAHQKQIQIAAGITGV